MTPWTAARQASLSITNSWSLLKLMSIESVMPSNHLILCRPLLFLPSIFPSIRAFPMSRLFPVIKEMRDTGRLCAPGPPRSHLVSLMEDQASAVFRCSATLCCRHPRAPREHLMINHLCAEGNLVSGCLNVFSHSRGFKCLQVI